MLAVQLRGRSGSGCGPDLHSKSARVLAEVSRLSDGLSPSRSVLLEGLALPRFEVSTSVSVTETSVRV